MHLTLPRPLPPQGSAADSSVAVPLAQPLAAVLRELTGVVGAITPAQYTQRCGEAFSNGTIGGHVRHCLDHIRALVDGRISGCIDYDHRARGTNIELSPAAAIDELKRLQLAATSLADALLAEPVTVAVMPARDGAGVRVASTVGRELAFVLSHTIHHNAMVKGMAVSLGIPLPRTFGYAPSTLAHLDAAPCAR